MNQEKYFACNRVRNHGDMTVLENVICTCENVNVIRDVQMTFCFNRGLSVYIFYNCLLEKYI